MRLPLVNVSSCPDKGLDALLQMNDPLLDLYEWIIILIALEQILSLSLIATRTYKYLTYFVDDTLTNCKVPTGLILWWSVFTAASVFLIGITMRANVAVFAKTIHVFLEALFLINFYSALKSNTISAGVSIIIGLVALWVLSFSDCNETVGLAALAGLTLDLFNFLSYLFLAFTQRMNRNLWTFVHGLGWHALYVIIFTCINIYTFPQASYATLRLLGAAINIVSVELFILLLVRIHLDSELLAGWTTIGEWKQSLNATNVWDNDRVIVCRKQVSSSHSAQESAYVKGSLYKFWFGFDSSTIRCINENLEHYLFVFKTRQYKVVKNVNMNTKVYVYDFSIVRAFRLFLATLVSIVLWYV